MCFVDSKRCVLEVYTQKFIVGYRSHAGVDRANRGKKQTWVFMNENTSRGSLGLKAKRICFGSNDQKH